MKKLLLLSSVLLVFACSDESSPPKAVTATDDPVATTDKAYADAREATPPPNILLIIADDMGLETLSVYGIGKDTAATPNLNALAERGMKFTNFWAQPMCSPTRATLITGRYGFRTGVRAPTGDGQSHGPYPPPPERPEGSPTEVIRGPELQAYIEELTPEQEAKQYWGLPSDEYTLPMAFAANSGLGYKTAAIGKWHLADRKDGWLDHPARVGFDYFDGSMRGFPDSYFAWIQVTNGEISTRTGYGPSAKVDDALDWISKQDSPWFMWFALNLPHVPLHLPPVELLNTEELKQLDPYGNPLDNPKAYFRAMIEAMDTEIGRLLSSLDPGELANTYIIFMGDNGSDRLTISAPYRPSGSKGTTYEGGVEVPLIVAGPGVPAGSTSEGLVNSVDLFTTIMEMAGIDPTNTIPVGVRYDSISIMPYLRDPSLPSIRKWIYADFLFTGPKFDTPQALKDRKAIRNATHKLVLEDGKAELFDMVNDPYENNDLLRGDKRADEVESAYKELLAQLEALLATESKQPLGER